MVSQLTSLRCETGTVSAEFSWDFSKLVFLTVGKVQTPSDASVYGKFSTRSPQSHLFWCMYPPCVGGNRLLQEDHTRECVVLPAIRYAKNELDKISMLDTSIRFRSVSAYVTHGGAITGARSHSRRNAFTRMYRNSIFQFSIDGKMRYDVYTKRCPFGVRCLYVIRFVVYIKLDLLSEADSSAILCFSIRFGFFT